jgi:hypothetical protein
VPTASQSISAAIADGALNSRSDGADSFAMAEAPKLPDLDALALELVHLEHRQRDLLRQHDKITERLMVFPNDFLRARAAALADDLEAMSARMDEIRVLLLPIRRVK